MRNMNKCFRYTGDAANYQYYRVFCDVPEPTKTIVNPVTRIETTTNVTNYIVYNVTNNITTFVPSIVRPVDVIAALMTLMVTNASFFKSLSVLSQAPPPNPVLINSVNATTNEPQKSGGGSLDHALLILVGVPVFFFFFLASPL
jgi:hypothetical protein